jgi:branched-chain amino acid aminotransferase
LASGIFYLYTILHYINLNGKITLATEAAIPIDNGSFRYGYGLFETMRVANGAICLKEYHWERLFAGMKSLYLEIAPLMGPENLEQQVLRTVKKNNLEGLSRVRLQIFAGGGGLYSSNHKLPSFLIECFPLDAAAIAFNENGLVAGIATGLYKSIDTLSNIKSCNALIYAIAARQAKENKWNDALICNTKNNIIESAIANIFWIKNGTVYTPPLSGGCVAGVMRRYVMAVLGDVVEKELHPGALPGADEVFLTNAIKGIRWVKNIDNSVYGNKMVQAINNCCIS